MSIKYYRLARDEDPPEEFCAVRDVGGEPSEYVFYVPESEAAKLRELVLDMYLCSDETCTDCEHHDYSGEGFWCKRGIGWKRARMRELGIEV